MSMQLHTNVVLFGDSICFGQGISPHLSWAGIVSARIEERFGDHVTVSNQGVNGQTTRQALERMPYDVQNHTPRMVCIQFGLNDANFWETDQGLPRVSPRAFAANLSEMVERARRFGALKVHLHTNHLPTRILPGGAETRYAENVLRYNQLIRDVAAETGSSLFDLETELAFSYRSGIPDSMWYLHDDGVHLSREGNQKYVQILSDAILDGIEEILRSRS